MTEFLGAATAPAASAAVVTATVSAALRPRVTAAAPASLAHRRRHRPRLATRRGLRAHHGRRRAGRTRVTGP
ncbi:hypothetical protein, partial [Burkholderia seminalis]|uniref:hypothetical protein n=1 Tax=Burkholderia seminalis TaxID=488731 RepID=UPI002652FE16